MHLKNDQPKIGVGAPNVTNMNMYDISKTKLARHVAGG